MGWGGGHLGGQDFVFELKSKRQLGWKSDGEGGASRPGALCVVTCRRWTSEGGAGAARRLEPNHLIPQLRWAGLGTSAQRLKTVLPAKSKFRLNR